MGLTLMLGITMIAYGISLETKKEKLFDTLIKDIDKIKQESKTKP